LERELQKELLLAARRRGRSGSPIFRHRGEPRVEGPTTSEPTVRLVDESSGLSPVDGSAAGHQEGDQGERAVSDEAGFVAGEESNAGKVVENGVEDSEEESEASPPVVIKQSSVVATLLAPMAQSSQPEVGDTDQETTAGAVDPGAGAGASGSDGGDEPTSSDVALGEGSEEGHTGVSEDGSATEAEVDGDVAAADAPPPPTGSSQGDEPAGNVADMPSSVVTSDSGPDAVEPGSEPAQETTVVEPVEPVEPAVMVQAGSTNPLPRIIAVANQKGGVGKTTTSVNLGAALAELGFRVLVVDLDPQGNATTGLGIDARNFELSMYDVLMRDVSMEDCIEPTSMKNLFVAPATIALAGAEIELVPAFSRELKLKRAIGAIIEDFDFVMIDCPPSLGLITVNALAAATEVLVPIQCEYYALEGLSQLSTNVHLVKNNLNPQLDISTIVLTMYDARTNLSEQVATDVRQHFENRVCRTVIPRTVRLSEAPSFGQPITAFDPSSRGALAYRELAKEVSGGAS